MKKTSIGILACGLLIWAAASAETTAPPTLADVVISINLLNADLPQKFDATPSAAQEKKALEACKTFLAASKQVTNLDDTTKQNLGLLGCRAGMAAGNPEVLLSGARLLWARADKVVTRDEIAPWLVLAGLYGASSDSAKTGIKHLEAVSKDWKKWTENMTLSAGQCDKPVEFSIPLVDGKSNFNVAAHRGKVIVLHFWSFTDPVSVQQVPDMKALYDAHKDDKNFEIVSILIDKNLPAPGGRGRGGAGGAGGGAGAAGGVLGAGIGGLGGGRGGLGGGRGGLGGGNPGNPGGGNPGAGPGAGGRNQAGMQAAMDIATLWPQAIDGAALRKQLGSTGVPYAAVIGPTGTVIWQGLMLSAKDQLENAVGFGLRQAENTAVNKAATTAPAATVATSSPAGGAADAKPPATLADDAAAKLKLAQSYIDSGLTDQAKKLLQDIVDFYPSTPSAATAKTLLAGLK